MEYASIERELYVEASPEITFEVVSRPEHLKEWWPDEADFSGEPGESGTIGFRQDGETFQVPLTVIVSDPPRTFTFRWTQDAGTEAITGNSLLVTFELVPQGSGTLVKLTETGFREMGWEAAKVAAEYADHVSGWDFFLPRLDTYVTRLVAS
ncbi:polyketide cyclase [Nocardioides marmoriginsengisoli]|uniref:Polyketide cyclase n=1 Tax=Nocardioides marmoriginsengisoli TaxID=661483 RepID=A0A3N0CR07_9ACTN|nr:SRPBCC domain-containing protein [Nocardioides marmoriginsengisoli]RNL65721.1 polyketide cyclase [Nocardioides marmoriginsengisoli]